MTFTSCKEDKNQVDLQSESGVSNNINSDLKTINFDFGFSVVLGEEESFDKFKTYTYFELKKNNRTIFIDSLLVEYEFGNKIYPIISQTGKDNYELLFEVNNRPNRNYSKVFFIKDDELVKTTILPCFEWEFNKDKTKYYIGLWENSQTYGDNYSLTSYNPILYYSITKNGNIRMDSILTIEKNKEIYGEFYGFTYNENIEISVEKLEKMNVELEKIKNNIE